MPLGRALCKSRLLATFSLSRSNRIGSDDKINSLAADYPVGSSDDLCESIKRSSLERLRTELAEKDRTITELRKQLDGISSREIVFMAPKPTYAPGRRPNRLRLSGLTRSASIISIGTWIKGLSRSARRRSVGDASAKLKNDSSAAATTAAAAAADDQAIETASMYRPKPSSVQPVPAVKIYSYGELLDGGISESELCLDHLEWHLGEDDLLEHLSICRDFLPLLDSGELFDRKYRASLTPEQYRHRRLSSLTQPIPYVVVASAPETCCLS